MFFEKLPYKLLKTWRLAWHYSNIKAFLLHAILVEQQQQQRKFFPFSGHNQEQSGATASLITYFSVTLRELLTLYH
jgi:hypothetical protein